MTNILSWTAANSTSILIAVVMYVTGVIATWWMLRGFETQPDCNGCFQDDSSTCVNCHPGKAAHQSGSLFEDDGAVFELMEILLHLLMSVFWPITIICLLVKYGWEWLKFASEFPPLLQLKESFWFLAFILILLCSRKEEDDLDHIIKG